MVRNERHAAGMICAGFHGATASPELRQMLARGVRSVILFTRNYESPAQLAELCREIKACVGHPVMICIDQEGGRVQRLREPFSIIPSMRELGSRADAAAVRRIGAAMARELRAVGIDMNLAPVLDVDSNPANPVIGERSFGGDPALVAQLGCAMIQGLQSAGIAACGKHFPGHGDTGIDTHLDLPRLAHDLARLEAVELVPFEAAIRGGVAAIMSSHIIFEPLDREFPATFSRRVLHDLLRERMNFQGVIASDDMEMGAIAKHFSFDQAIAWGVEAGIDLFMVCSKHELQDQAIQCITKAAEQGTIAARQVEDSQARLSMLIERFVHPPSGHRPLL